MMQAHRQLLFDRYPEIAFRLLWTPFVSRAPSVLSDERLKAWQEALDLRGIEVLYLCGIGSGQTYRALKPWLEGCRQRLLVILEGELAAIDALLHVEGAGALLADPQVRLHLEFGDLHALLRCYPTDRCDVVADPLCLHKRRFAQFRQRLLRASASFSALLMDAVHAHHLSRNVLSNMARLPDAFFANALAGQFVGIPAIICGAGPSLERSIPHLRQLEQRALIFAGGSAISALSFASVRPHLCLAFDPNPEEVERLASHTASGVPLIFGTRLNPDVWKLSDHPAGYLSSDTGGALERWFEEQLGMERKPIGPELSGEALSVTTIALAYAYAMGCQPILLCGVDLAYTRSLYYAPGVVPSPRICVEQIKQKRGAGERLCYRRARGGGRVRTLLKWIMEADAIGAFAVQRPDRLFLNVTEEGLRIPHVADCAIQEAMDKHCTGTYDLRGQIHTVTQEAHLGIPRERIHQLFEQLQGSLQRCILLCGQLEQASNVESVLLEEELAQERAYAPLLQGGISALKLIIRWQQGNATAPRAVMYQQLKTIAETELQYLQQALNQAG